MGAGAGPRHLMGQARGQGTRWGRRGGRALHRGRSKGRCAGMSRRGRCEGYLRQGRCEGTARTILPPPRSSTYRCSKVAAEHSALAMISAEADRPGSLRVVHRVNEGDGRLEDLELVEFQDLNSKPVIS